jgi:hypothetical protein
VPSRLKVVTLMKRSCANGVMCVFVDVLLLQTAVSFRNETVGVGALVARSTLRLSIANMRACMIQTTRIEDQEKTNRSSHRGRTAW